MKVNEWLELLNKNAITNCDGLNFYNIFPKRLMPSSMTSGVAFV
jgi:hypothetical protein